MSVWQIWLSKTNIPQQARKGIQSAIYKLSEVDIIEHLNQSDYVTHFMYITDEKKAELKCRYHMFP